MAVDTRNKRTSVIGMITPVIPYHPVADGSIDTAAERLQLLKLYAGTVVVQATGKPIVFRVPNKRPAFQVASYKPVYRVPNKRPVFRVGDQP